MSESVLIVAVSIIFLLSSGALWLHLHNCMHRLDLAVVRMEVAAGTALEMMREMKLSNERLREDLKQVRSLLDYLGTK